MPSIEDQLKAATPQWQKDRDKRPESNTLEAPQAVYHTPPSELNQVKIGDVKRPTNVGDLLPPIPDDSDTYVLGVSGSGGSARVPVWLPTSSCGA